MRGSILIQCFLYAIVIGNTGLRFSVKLPLFLRHIMGTLLLLQSQRRKGRQSLKKHHLRALTKAFLLLIGDKILQNTALIPQYKH